MSGAFVHPVNVTWGDCDPARIAYTARLPAFALEAINGWWEAHLNGDGWYQMELDRNVGTPFVKIEMEFFNPVTPRHPLLCETFPTRLGTKSITFAVKGRQDGVLCFSGSFTSVFTIADRFQSQTCPPELAAVIQPRLRVE